MNTVKVPFTFDETLYQKSFDRIDGLQYVDPERDALSRMSDDMERRAVSALQLSKLRIEKVRKSKLDTPREALKYVVTPVLTTLLKRELNLCHNARCGQDFPTSVRIETQLPYDQLSDRPVPLSAAGSVAAPREYAGAFTGLNPASCVVAFLEAKDFIMQHPVDGNVCVSCLGNNPNNPNCRFQ